MTPLPSLFISHGSPDLVVQSCPATEFFRALPQHLAQVPTAILVVSAHWGTSVPTVSSATAMTAVHDFYGFADELYQLHYEAPGAPELTEQTVALLSKAGFAPQTSHRTQLDHGAWEPLLLAYPAGNIPVAQLSIQPRLGPEHHLHIGRALAPLRDANILIVASGSMTHNLRQFGAYPLNAPPVDWAQHFDRWMAEAIARQDLSALLNYLQDAPYAIQNHPTQEHLLPLFVALGAGGPDSMGQLIHSSFTYGVFSMSAVAFR